MADLESIRKFEYRRCRMKTGFDIDFVTNEETFHGTCRDVSDAGVCAEFEGSAPLGCTGLLILRHPSGVLRVQAQVAYIERSQVGLEFVFKTASESKLTIEFISSIASFAGTSR